MSRLIFLNPGVNKIQTIDTHSKKIATLVDSVDGFPDGVIVDPQTRHIYWTNMGKVDFKDGNSFDNDGSIERVDNDGSHRITIIPIGNTRTPKQLTASWSEGKIYWSDREGLRVWRANLDGSEQELLIERGSTDEDRHDFLRQCVGIAVDSANSYLYWTQKGDPKGGHGRIFRASLNIPAGYTAANREDIELLWENLPEPIDLYIDYDSLQLYWSDRGAEPDGNTLNTAPIPAPGKKGEKPTILLRGLVEGIGLDRDESTKTIYITDLGGNIHYYELTTGKGGLFTHVQGVLTGIVVDSHT